MTQTHEIRTTCAYCGVGCGIVASRDENGALQVRGDTNHPANLGRLCSKGSALADTISTQDRLTTPLVDGRSVDWETAIDVVAERFKATIAEYGPDSVAFYVSGQLLTEDYYVANKLMKGFIGSANIDTNSRLCMASTVAGHKRAFGTDTVPGTYEDIENADLVVLVGSNLAWCHPVIYQRLCAAKSARPELRVVNIDPRRTVTCDIADLHLPLRLGTDVALFNHLLAEIAARGAVDESFKASVEGLEEAIASARQDDVAVCGLEPADVEAFVQLFVKNPKVVTIFSQGVNQSSAGSDKVNAILNCHLATGRIGKEGMGPFSVTGQPNAMGGREVGGLANMLACHLDIENAEHRDVVKTFWDAPVMPEHPGYKAVEMFRKVEDGSIKAIWIMCTNPVVSLPEADRVKAALEACDFVVVSDLFGNVETAKLADVVLPATGWGEKNGTVTNSDRVISRQRQIVEPPEGARSDWDIMSAVARGMGFAGFDYANPAEIFEEYARLSGACSVFERDFDISGLIGVDYERMNPTRWPISSGGESRERFFADGKFFTPSGKARAVALTYREPESKREPRFPFRLNTGRIRDQWHTMTRSGRAPKLGQHLPEPFVEIHPEDAKRIGVEQNSLVELSSPTGRVVLRSRITEEVAQGELFAPIHWTDVFASQARVDTLVRGVVDPISGQPESKASVVAATPFQSAWHGFAILSKDVTPDCEYWSRARIAGGWRMEMSGKSDIDAAELAQKLLGKRGDLLSYMDFAKGSARFALLENGKVTGALFLSRTPLLISKDYITTRLHECDPAILAGRPSLNMPDPGPTVCSCFSVGTNTILAAIEEGNLMSVDEVGRALKAGTNCGSCKPEIAGLLSQIRRREAAE